MSRADSQLATNKGGLVAAVRQTQATLGRIVVRPVMTDKLLMKPPFRFLHDVISAVGTRHPHCGLTASLTAAEADSTSAGATRQSKMQYLAKIIDRVEKTTGIDLTDVKPSKIVAGQEAERTNRFLQAIATLVNTDGMDCRHFDVVGPSNFSDEVGRSDVIAAAAATEPTKLMQLQPRQPDKQTEELEQSLNHDIKTAAQQQSKSPSEDRIDVNEEQKEDIKDAVEMEPLEVVAAAATDSPCSVIKAARPSSARPAAPHPHERTRIAPPKSTVDKLTAAASDETVVLSPTAAITAAIDDDDDGDVDDFIVEADSTYIHDRRPHLQQRQAEDIDNIDVEGRGALVQHIMDGRMAHSASTELSASSSSPAATVVDTTDVVALQAAIQDVTKTANSVTGLMEYARDDIEAMHREHQLWANECVRLTDALVARRAAAVEAVAPLQRQLDSVLAQIDDVKLKIALSRAAIIKNDVRIARLVNYI